MLEQLIPSPRLRELDHVDLGVSPERAWQQLRHGDLAPSALIRALFAVRNLPDRLRGKPVSSGLRVDDLKSSPERPGFQILAEDPPREFAVGAVGKVWQPEIPFVHVSGPAEFSAFEATGFVKVAWAIRVLPRGEHDCRVEIEVRVDATDAASWSKFRRYFRLIGPGSHFIRRTLLASLARELGTPEAKEGERLLPGDELLSDAAVHVTQGITIEASPESIWPWLLQMGSRRAGFYAIDLLDNGGFRSARELHPELLSLEVGQIIPSTPGGNDGFEVLRLEAPRVLVLGGLYDAAAKKQLAFSARRPERFWQITWAFVLERLDARSTRLHVRARAAFAKGGHFHAAWVRPVHGVMQGSMLRHLKERAEGRLPRDDARDVVEGLGGAARMFGAWLTPFLRRARSHWGIDEKTAQRSYPGDELITEPRWSWTHGVEIDAAGSEVWPWVAQLGADRGGFYSYQWLENLVGCEVRNAETVRPEWQLQPGQPLVLHPDPKAPRLLVAEVEPGHHLVASAPADVASRERGGSWSSATWLLFVESLGERRCRLISRYRVACSDDLATRLAFGPTLVEPVGFAMDRRMLFGVKERAERARRAAVSLPRAESTLGAVSG